jgi:hypothetical protein
MVNGTQVFPFFTRKRSLMQTRNRKSWMAAALAVVASALLYSFTAPAGGDVVRVYLNKKLVMEQYGPNMRPDQAISIANARPGDQLAVYYGHCGQLGTNRTITIRDDANSQLKQWRFANSGKYMVCPVKDLNTLQRGKRTLRIYYAADELRSGKWVATLLPKGEITAP